VVADKKLEDAYGRVSTAIRLWRKDHDVTAKAMWKVASIAMIRRIATLIKGSVTQVHFIQGGPAVSGEATAFIMFNRYPRMAYIHLSADFPSYIRSASGQKDYLGGPNFSLHIDEGLEMMVADLVRFFESGMDV